MKNKYTISPNFLLQLENDELRERIKKLISDYEELKKLYEKVKKDNTIEDDGVDQFTPFSFVINLENFFFASSHLL